MVYLVVLFLGLLAEAAAVLAFSAFLFLWFSNLSCLSCSALARAPLMVLAAPEESISLSALKFSFVSALMARFVLFVMLVRSLRCSAIVVASFLLHSWHVASHFATKARLSFIASRAPSNLGYFVSKFGLLFLFLLCLCKLNPSVHGLMHGGLIRLHNLSANILKSVRISKLVRSQAMGMKVNPLLNTSFSGTLNVWLDRFNIKFSAQVTQFIILQVYRE